MGLNDKATPQVLGTKTWDCKLDWDFTVQVKIEGSKYSAIDKAGGNTGEFVVHFKNSRVSVRLRVECTDGTGQTKLVAKSKTFNVFPDLTGKTGLFSLQTTAIKYSGPYTFIKSVIDSVPSVALKKCEGASCPQVVSRRRRDAPARVSNGSRLNLASYQMQASPVCVGPQGDLTCN